MFPTGNRKKPIGARKPGIFDYELADPKDGAQERTLL
jgi:hypothetical protein